MTHAADNDAPDFDALETAYPAVRLERLTADFREWFAQTNPSDANRDQFDRWVIDLLDAVKRVIPPGETEGDR